MANKCTVHKLLYFASTKTLRLQINDIVHGCHNQIRSVCSVCEAVMSRN